MSRRIVIAYWLIPTEPARSFFQGIINDLAQRYNAPVFEPHVTVHVGGSDAEAAEKALTEAARDCDRIELEPLDVRHSSEFIKTLLFSSARTQNCGSSIKSYVRHRKTPLITSSIRT